MHQFSSLVFYIISLDIDIIVCEVFLQNLSLKFDISCVHEEFQKICEIGRFRLSSNLKNIEFESHFFALFISHK